MIFKCESCGLDELQCECLECRNCGKLVDVDNVRRIHLGEYECIDCYTTSLDNLVERRFKNGY